MTTVVASVAARGAPLAPPRPKTSKTETLSDHALIELLCCLRPDGVDLLYVLQEAEVDGEEGTALSADLTKLQRDLAAELVSLGLLARGATWDEDGSQWTTYTLPARVARLWEELEEFGCAEERASSWS